MIWRGYQNCHIQRWGHGGIWEYSGEAVELRRGTSGTNRRSLDLQCTACPSTMTLRKPDHSLSTLQSPVSCPLFPYSVKLILIISRCSVTTYKGIIAIHTVKVWKINRKNGIFMVKLSIWSSRSLSTTFSWGVILSSLSSFYFYFFLNQQGWYRPFSFFLSWQKTAEFPINASGSSNFRARFRRKEKAINAVSTLR